MSTATAPSAASLADFYRELEGQCRGLLHGERDFTANSANLAALLFSTIPDLNWAGFYWLKEGELVLGPFQGRPACVRIAIGRGVCGTAAERRSSMVVEDVNAFPGHIACDTASRSEVVVPVIKEGRLLGVLDLDSPTPARFSEEDARGLERLVAAFCELTETP